MAIPARNKRPRTLLPQPQFDMRCSAKSTLTMEKKPI
jgi:hypothetical protein